MDISVLIDRASSTPLHRQIYDQWRTGILSAKWMTDRHTTLLEQAALADFIREGHLERHVRRMRRLYKHRREVLVEALDRHFGNHAVVRGDAAGMHLIVRFRAADAIRARAERNGVDLTGTGMCYMTNPVPNEFIIGFSAIGERTTREAVRRLALRE